MDSSNTHTKLFNILHKIAYTLKSDGIIEIKYPINVECY